MTLDTTDPGPIHEPEPTRPPGRRLTFIPVCTESPMIAPSFFLPVFTSLPFTRICTGCSSKRMLAVMVPAPRLHSSPSMLSPTYDRCGILDPLITMLFLISHEVPTMTRSWREVLGRILEFGPMTQPFPIYAGPSP